MTNSSIWIFLSILSIKKERTFLASTLVFPISECFTVFYCTVATGNIWSPEKDLTNLYTIDGIPNL